MDLNEYIHVFREGICQTISCEVIFRIGDFVCCFYLGRADAAPGLARVCSMQMLAVLIELCLLHGLSALDKRFEGTKPIKISQGGKA